MAQNPRRSLNPDLRRGRDVNHRLAAHVAPPRWRAEARLSPPPIHIYPETHPLVVSGGPTLVWTLCGPSGWGVGGRARSSKAQQVARPAAEIGLTDLGLGRRPEQPIPSTPIDAQELNTQRGHDKSQPSNPTLSLGRARVALSPRTPGSPPQKLARQAMRCGRVRPTSTSHERATPPRTPPQKRRPPAPPEVEGACAGARPHNDSAGVAGKAAARHTNDNAASVCKCAQPTRCRAPCTFGTPLLADARVGLS